MRKPKIKICGITNYDQAKEIINLGVDALGFNFWKESKRFISIDESSNWLKKLQGKVLRIAVTVNATDEEVNKIVDSNIVDLIQLHGDETKDRFNYLISKGISVFKALRIKNDQEIKGVENFLNSNMILLDTYSSSYGGSGKVFDWEIASKAVIKYPNNKIILAGGLTPDNVREAILKVNPYMVDVASGVENNLYLKDYDKVRKFIREAT